MFMKDLPALFHSPLSDGGSFAQLLSFISCVHTQVFTWGTNDFGQLGNGNTSYDIHPRRVVDLDDVPIADIATGGWWVVKQR
eukprot:487630-Pelagomonas_calceolata.AAC.6